MHKESNKFNQLELKREIQILMHRVQLLETKISIIRQMSTLNTLELIFLGKILRNQMFRTLNNKFKLIKTNKLVKRR
jgi:hypothetical protein